MTVSKTKALSLETINNNFDNIVPKFFFLKKKIFKNKIFYINKIIKKFSKDIIIRSSAL